MGSAAVTGIVRHCRASAKLTNGGHRENRLGIVVLQQVLLAYMPGSEDRDEWSRRGSLLDIGPPFRLFPFHQAHRANDFESEFAGRFDGLDRGRAGGADV